MTAHPEYIRKTRRARMVGVFALCGAGVGVLLPILPGVLFLLLGLSILSVRSKTAHRKLATLRARYPDLMQPVERIESWVYDTLDLTTHTHEYTDIPLGDGRSLPGVIERSEIAGQGVAVILHGASGTMETALSQALAETFRAQGHTVVRFDAYHGIGSRGAYAVFSVTEYLDDLSRVLEWIAGQEWGAHQVLLVGHSIGGLVAGLYASRYPEQVHSLHLLAPTLTGAMLSAGYRASAVDLDAWRDIGLREVTHPLSGETYGLGYHFVEDAQQYDLTSHAQALTMPVRIAGAPHDPFAPTDACRSFAQTVGPQAIFTPLSEMPHTPTTSKDVQVAALAVS